jgi:hypothetical protein
VHRVELAGAGPERLHDIGFERADVVAELRALDPQRLRRIAERPELR